jgi:hypothetical protein
MLVFSNALFILASQKGGVKAAVMRPERVGVK